MSKIGEAPITLPQDVQVEVKDRVCTVRGKDGEMKVGLTGAINVEVKDQLVIVTKKQDDKKTRSLHGLYRNLIANAIAGVQKPWEKKLEVVGTGYNVQQQGENLTFKLGFSHPVVFETVPGIKLKVEEGNKVTVSGIDKQLVGQVAQRIKSLRKPDAYKGKGIKYEGEQVRIKPGKKTGATEGA